MEVFTTVLLLLIVGYVQSNPARESYQRTADILKIVERIEEQVNKENRLREITDIFRMDSTLDKMSKKLDRLVELMEGPRSSNLRSSSSDLAVPDDVSGKLEDIDDRLSRLEEAMKKVNDVLSSADLKKLGDIDQRSVQLKDDLNQKLRKMMNIITALYEMSKDMKTNLGGRSDSAIETPRQSTATSNSAADFFVENLEELERKIKEQFSVLTNEIRSEVTGLKIVAASLNSNCNPTATDGPLPTDLDYDYPAGRSVSGRNSAVRTSRRDGSTRSDESTDNTLTALVQGLSRTTREIREEIQQRMQSIDHKLTNLTNMPIRCDSEALDTSASLLQPVRVSRGFDLPPPSEQRVDTKTDRKKESCSKVARNVASPRSCAELRQNGATCDGKYVIFPTRGERAVRVWCDMTTDGGGWTVLVRRGDYGSKMTSFHRNWLSYKNGFGDVEGEFWIGNDNIHLLTHQDNNSLRVHLESFDSDDLNLTYSLFNVADESDHYRLKIGPTTGQPVPAANSLKYHNNHPFSTFDKKNDPFDQNCAATYKGGWWFNGCYFGFLTGEYFKPGDKRENWQGILWYDWKGNASLKGGFMMIRPMDFNNHH